MGLGWAVARTPADGCSGLEQESGMAARRLGAMPEHSSAITVCGAYFDEIRFQIAAADET